MTLPLQHSDLQETLDTLQGLLKIAEDSYLTHSRAEDLQKCVTYIRAILGCLDQCNSDTQVIVC